MIPKSMPKQMSDLRLPNLEWDYLGAAKNYPFDHNQDALSLVNAWWLMEIAFLVYAPDPNFVNQKLRAAGFDGVLSIHRQSNHVLVIRDPKKLIVCFRGTLLNNLDNLVTDAKIVLTDFDNRGKVHRGFLRALDSLWDDLEQELAARSGGREVWFTGHSLGAALAVLAAARWRHPSRIYTYGCPRVGDGRFRDQYPTRTHYRFVHDHDVITQLPPPLGYRHLGEVCHLRRDGKIEDGTGAWRQFKDNMTKRLPGLLKKIRDDKAVWESLLGDNAFSDHCPVSYATRLWNLIEI